MDKSLSISTLKHNGYFLCRGKHNRIIYYTYYTQRGCLHINRTRLIFPVHLWETQSYRQENGKRRRATLTIVVVFATCGNNFYFLIRLKSAAPNTSVEFSPSHPAFAFTPVCIFIKSIYCRFAGLPSKVTASLILKWFAFTPAL